jgi:hypothetical protein
MNKTEKYSSLELTGISGANPLGFLTALGVLVVLHRAGLLSVRLGWKRSVSWTPVLEGLPTTNDFSAEDTVVSTLTSGLRGSPVPEEAESARINAEQEVAAAKRKVDEGRRSIKDRRLRGKERDEALLLEVEPLEGDFSEKRAAWLDSLSQAAPRPELAIGKHLDCKNQEFIGHIARLLGQSSQSNRENLDMFSAFGTDIDADQKSRIASTPFCFITGSGHQYFLDTIRQLLEKVTPEKIRAALFEPWKYQDEKLSMRWDPIDDRRYALMDRDPTASDNKSQTVWMANLLAYRSLALYPTAAISRRTGIIALGTTGWIESDSFTWPIWNQPAAIDSIRSVLQLSELTRTEPDTLILFERGIVAAFRARRIKVGNPPLYKINFSPAQSIMGRFGK